MKTTRRVLLAAAPSVMLVSGPVQAEPQLLEATGNYYEVIVAEGISYEAAKAAAAAST